MEEEYQKLDSEQNEEQKDCECNADCDCGCNDGHECTCGEEDYSCNCDKIEKLFIVSAVANIITTLFVVIIAGVLLYITFAPAGFEFGRRDAQQQPKEPKALFNKKGISLEDAMKDEKLAVVLFYADWCPHCQNFAPTFKKLSKDRKLKSKFNFVRINSEDPNARAIMEEYNVEGFPALFLVDPKTNEKQFISNGLLFGEGAIDNLKDIFKGYAESRENK